MIFNFFLTHYFLYTTSLFKNPSFLENIYKIKPLSRMPKGLECLGSPYWTASELLRGIWP